jgi:hypothetical protein
MDQDSVKLGLLMETAERHQRLAEAAIGKLTEQVQGLEAVVRDQIRGAVAREMKIVEAESQRAVEALQRVKRAANARVVLWPLGLTAIAGVTALFIVWWVVPTRSEIEGLRIERDQLARNITVLNQRGARADLRLCETRRLCVRVDLKAPRYGEGSDYLVIRGY